MNNKSVMQEGTSVCVCSSAEVPHFMMHYTFWKF